MQVTESNSSEGEVREKYQHGILHRLPLPQLGVWHRTALTTKLGEATVYVSE